MNGSASCVFIAHRSSFIARQMPHATNETLRKGLHIAFGLGAFALRWLPWYAAAGVCVVAILGNWLGLHRIVGRGVARHERGFDAGIVLYPVMVLLLIVVFRDRLHYAAIGWAMLAFGDGIATLAGKERRLPAGRSTGGPPVRPAAGGPAGQRPALQRPARQLPWNRDKSWPGFIACFLASAIFGLAVAYWMDFRAPVVVIIAALAAAITESLPLGVDDNVTVPIAAAAALAIAGIDVASAYSVWPDTVPWLLMNGALAIAGHYLRSVSGRNARRPISCPISEAVVSAAAVASEAMPIRYASTIQSIGSTSMRLRRETAIAQIAATPTLENAWLKPRRPPDSCARPSFALRE
jgi:dolichol kinase